jgi:hypothetical protein
MDHADEVGVEFLDVKWEWFGLIIWGASDDGCESLVVFRNRVIGHAAKSWVEDGLLATCEILLDGGVWDISRK